MALLAQPPLWLAVALLIAVCFFCAYGTVIVAHACFNLNTVGVILAGFNP